MLYSDYSILEMEIDKARKSFWHSLLTNKPANMTESAQTYIFILTLRPFGIQIFNLLSQYRYFFFTEPIFLAWSIRVKL